MRKPIDPRPGGNKAHTPSDKVSSSSFLDTAIAGIGCELGRIERRGSTGSGVAPQVFVRLGDRVIRPK